jgi:multicomponent Na+:H+ antiporter subunit C
MSSALLYSITGLGIFAIGLLGIVLAGHVMRKILALNIMGIGIFMLLIAIAKQDGAFVDPVPHAMVLTGIVIAAAGTALALNLMVRLHRMSDPKQGKPK